MKRITIAVVAVVLLAGLAGCVSSEGSADSTQQSDEAELKEDSTTFTKPAPQEGKVWSCIAWDKHGAHADNQLQCELVNSTEGGY